MKLKLRYPAGCAGALAVITLRSHRTSSVQGAGDDVLAFVPLGRVHSRHSLKQAKQLLAPGNVYQSTHPSRSWHEVLVLTSAAAGAAMFQLRRTRRQLQHGNGRIVRACTVSPAGEENLCPSSITADEMPGLYDFQTVEEDLYQWWESSGFFKPEIADSIPPVCGERQSYVIPMPPPNVTGRLHMGHAMFASLEDALARFHRMYGDRTLWLPGTDHAGIATQMLVERQLASEGTSRQAVGREAFLERVWEWKAEKGGAIIEQLRRIGASCDWSREQFTLNEQMSGAVTEAFVRLHEKGVIFKGQRMVNWSPRLQTAVSDLEVEYTEQSGNLYYFKYIVAGPDGKPEDRFIPVATTRPETILGDSAVCVHPEDPRYQDLIGREVLVPMQGRRIPVIADEYVDREFGTGALKITPAHDFNDFEIAQRHALPFYTVIGLDAKISESVDKLGSPQYKGMDRFLARKALWADLETEDIAIKVEDHVQRVPLSQRSGEIIEPMLSDQWFVNTEDMAQRALDVVESGEIKIQPDRYTKIWRGWLQEKQPWCISRQLWWGHRIPVYYPTNRPDSEKYYVARSEEEAKKQAQQELGEDVELRQDPDVLDTWFSSGLWPFATVGWPDESSPDFQKYFPATMMETGYDILFFWVARMVMMSLALTDKSPFKEIYLHGLVRDEAGQKMSKTKGNVVDPLDSIAKYGTDALRYSLLTSVVPGMDVPLSKGMLENAKSFANKIWNVGRFIITEYQKSDAAKSGMDAQGLQFTVEEFKSMPWLERALISKCHGLVERVTQSLLENKFGEPTKQLAEFVRDDIASWYIEAAKTRLQPHLGGNPAGPKAAQTHKVLLYALEVSLRLLHPFMPFITEAVWQRLPRQSSSATSLMISSWLDVKSCSAMRDEQAEKWFVRMTALVSQVRNARAEHDVPPKERVPLTFFCGDSGFQHALQEECSAVAWCARADPDNIRADSLSAKGENKEGVVRIVVSEDLEVDMPVPKQEIDVEKEVQRLKKQYARITGQLEGAQRKITPSFLEKANPQARDKILQKVEDLRQQQEAVVAQLNEFGVEEKLTEPLRRTVVAGALCAALSWMQPAQANVGEGDELPNGARQENRLRKGLEAWKNLGTKTMGGEVKTNEEWQNTQGFLRRLYSLQDDMNYLARGLKEEKKQQAETVITKFKKRVKEADKPAKAKDLEAISPFFAEISGYINNFLDLLTDVEGDLEMGDAEVVA